MLFSSQTQSPLRGTGIPACRSAQPNQDSDQAFGLLTGKNACPPDQRPRRAAGFSLVEILLSLGIFAIGMTAIVSLFPAAAILQRETTQEVISEMAAQSAASIINAQQLTYEWTGTASTGDLAFYHPAGSTNSEVESIAGLIATQDRCYPTGVIDLGAGTVADAIRDCDMHWVPFIQDISGDPTDPSWVVRLFILEADSRADYSGTLPGGTDAVANGGDPATFPRVVSEGGAVSGTDNNVFVADSVLGLEPGDTVMDNNGNSHLVVNVTDNGTNAAIEMLNAIPQVPNPVDTLWYAPQMGGSSSPSMRVVTVEITIVEP